MEILKEATNKFKSDLTEYHEYEDGGVDQPFLTPESVKDE